MADQVVRRSDLRPEFQTPEFAAVLLGLLEIAEEDVKRVAVYQERGAHNMTLVSWTILWHVFVVVCAYDRGTRAQTLIDSLPVPRRTIRDSLKRMVNDGFLVRDDAGLYWPSTVTAELKHQVADARVRQVRRLAVAYTAFEKAYDKPPGR